MHNTTFEEWLAREINKLASHKSDAKTLEGLLDLRESIGIAFDPKADQETASGMLTHAILANEKLARETEEETIVDSVFYGIENTQIDEKADTVLDIDLSTSKF